jgi:curved DNA-binding protein
MEYRDYYKTLGVPRTATQADIKKAFRKLARDHHPDRNAGDKAAESRFKDINEAHAVLGDPEKRKRYDVLGANWDAFQQAGGRPTGAQGDPFGPGGPFAGFTSSSGRSGNVRYEFRTSGDTAGFSDFFRTMFGAAATPEAGRGRARAGGAGTATEPSIEELLAGMGLHLDETGSVSGSGRSGSRGRSQPAAAEATAELTLEEAFHGTARVVEVDGKRLEVTIPRGADTGSRIRLTGRGPGGADLVVIVKVRPHKVFRRKGTDLEREVALSLEEALLGAAVPVATLKGRVLLTVPPGTQNGRTFRLTGQGMPRFRGEGTGDLFVRTRVVLPTDLSPEARRAAERFLELAAQPDPRAPGA